MDCAHDAAEIQRVAAAVDGVREAKVSVATQIMTTRVDDLDVLPSLERAVASIGYSLERMDRGIDGEKPAPPSKIASAYTRALWVVVILNVGYGMVEAIAGFLAGSQALKADALDFLGDGLISFLALLAMGWRLVWRARVALVQGLFLGALGVGVLGSTAYRVLVLNRPDAELMGAFGGMALLVNVAAALVLIPHRAGDANARAVWLFSRNDALGNLAVVGAAALVAWTGEPWPDLVVAAVIACLFLHSSWVIVRDARAELTDPA